MTGIDPEQAERIGTLYAKALSNYDKFGTFQLALSNSMAHRSYNWDLDQFERVLAAMVEFESSTSVPRDENWEAWDRYMSAEKEKEKEADR